MMIMTVIMMKIMIIHCKTREEEQCHETYVTFFNAATEEQVDVNHLTSWMHVFPSPLLFVFFKTLNILPNAQCDETFEKKCQITFRSKAVTEPVSSFLVVHYRRSQKKKLLSIKKRRSFCKYIFWRGQGKLKTRTNFEQQKTTKKQMTGVGEAHK